MNNPYELILEGKHHNEVLHAAAAATKFDSDTFANLVPQSKVAEIGEYASEVCRTSGVQADLIVGGLLELFAAVSDEDHCPEVMAELIDEIQVSRTQAYRCRAVWRQFGKALIDEPDIRARFGSESLKTLAEGQASDEARQEAIELARAGTKITIKIAKQLMAKHAPPVDATPTKTPTDACTNRMPGRLKSLFGKAFDNLWTYTGQVVQIVLAPTTTTSHADRRAVIEDLQAAIERLQQEIIDESHSEKELTHV